MTPLTLWCDRPAEEVLTEGLPLGNGQLGLLISGGTPCDHWVLNESTLWSAGPYDPNQPGAHRALPEVRRLVFSGEYRAAAALAEEGLMGSPKGQASYQPLGSLFVSFPGHSCPAEYRRELDLDRALATVRYLVDGTEFTREVFVSAPDQVLVARFRASRPGALGCTLRLCSEQRPAVDWLRRPEPWHSQRGCGIRGKNRAEHGIEGALGFEFAAMLRPVGGRVMPGEKLVGVRDADELVLVAAAATSYGSYQDVGRDPRTIVEERLGRAGELTFEGLLERHLGDYQAQFRRLGIELGSPSASSGLPTDSRIAGFGSDTDPALAALYVQYARYLLLACSRAGSQPANLQGLWNDKLDPPWGSKCTLNVNTEMNYWPAHPGALPECAEPLFGLVEELAEAGRKTARAHYGARGWVAHHNTDAWRATAPIDGVEWGLWPMGGAWLCWHLWDHYRFTLSRPHLERAYPLLKGAAEFFADSLVRDPRSGHWVTCPSISPENQHPLGTAVCAGPTMDNAILRDLLQATAEAASLLGVDPEFRRQLLEIRANLGPYRIGRAGQLQEWQEDWDLEAPEPHHRHLSHLFGLYPSHQISPTATPELARAARRTLELRGDEATGWSLGVKINLWARLGDGERAYQLLKLLISPDRSYTNLFDAHPPFQIDGNFGGAAGILEMLVESEMGRLHLLPALPAAWAEGELHGVKARGGLTVDLCWKNHALVDATITSLVDQTMEVRVLRRAPVEVALTAGVAARLSLISVAPCRILTSMMRVSGSGGNFGGVVMVALGCVGIDACSEPFVRVGSDSTGGTGNQTALPMGGTTYTSGMGGTVPDAGEGGQDAAAATFAHFPLASVGPLVRGVAAVARDADSILVLGEIRETPWLSLRRVPHGLQDWSEEWGSLPLTTAPVPPSSLGAARLGQGVGVYYPGSLLRFDEGGQLIGTPEAVPGECTVSPGGDSVWLACVDVGVGITLRTCPAGAGCSDPVLLEPMSQYTGTPVAVGERDPIQVIYELSADGVEWTLRRAFVDRATLTLQAVQTLTAQPFAPGPFSTSLPGLAIPAALALPDRLLVAYGIPHQFGVWDDSGSLLFSAAPEDSYAVGRRFSPFAGVAEDLHTVETSWADLGDAQSRATRLFRISRTSLELTDSTVLIAADPPSDSSGDVLADPDAPTAVWLRSEGYPWSPLAGDALRAPLTGQPLANLEPSVAVGELRGLLPRLLACDALGCTLLVERHLVTLGTPGKVLGLLTLDRAHGSVELPSSGVTDWGMDDPLRVEGGKTFLTRGMRDFPLWAFDQTTGSYTELSPGSDRLLEAFVEGDGLRVFVSTDADQVVAQGLVTGGALGEFTPVSLDAGAMIPQRGIDESPIARCAGKYTSLMTVAIDPGDFVYQMDPGTESDFSLVTTLSPSESVWFWCTDAAFYLALSDTIAVFGSTALRGIGLPALADGALLSTATTADRLYLLWGFGLDGSVASTPRFALTSVSGDGSVTEQELALPPGRQARISGFFYDRVPLDVSDDEVRVAWVADDGTPFISILPR